MKVNHLLVYYLEQKIGDSNAKDKNIIYEKIKNDNDNEIEELTKIIDVIENSENINNKNEININNSEEININKNYKKRPRIIDNNKIINTNKKIFDAL